MATNARLRTSVRDMLLSLAVIAVPIALVLILKPSKPGDPVHVIDNASYQTMLSAARQSEPFTVVVPTGLPTSWRLTSAYYEPQGATAADWHLGYLTPSGGYASVEQTTEPLASFLNDQHSDASPNTAVQITGATPNVWQRYTGTKPTGLRTLLFHTDAKSTVMVAGSATMTELEELATDLH